MHPDQTGENYDQLATWWRERHDGSTYGLRQLQRAIQFVSDRGLALDVGCGSEGRFIRVMCEEGFTPLGLDISANMIANIQDRYPEVQFIQADICTWQPTQTFDLITAWDSTFHLPLNQQQPVLEKLCDALSSAGVIMFTCGNERGEITGSFEGCTFGYSSLGIAGFVEVLTNCGCELRHLELDQYPEPHVYIVAQKI